jgi:hypothetical protein
LAIKAVRAALHAEVDEIIYPLHGRRRAGRLPALVRLPHAAARRRPCPGFVVRPYRNRFGRFGEFWENLYTWFIMWTFNAASLHGRRVLGLRRMEMWMTAEDFVQRFGG